MSSWKIFQWNANSIQKKGSELSKVLIDNNIHLAAIQESGLKSTNKRSYPGYICLRKDIDNSFVKSRGLMLIIKKDVIFSEQEPLETDLIEVQHVILYEKDKAKTIHLYNIYVKHTFLPWCQAKSAGLHLDKIKIDTNNTNIFLGDMNAIHSTWDRN